MVYLKILVLGLLATSPLAWSQDQKQECGTMNPKECFMAKVKAKAESESRVLEPNSEILGPIERDAKGDAIKKNQLDSIQHCQSIGLRLPTVKELAHFGKSLGAVGIFNTPEPNTTKPNNRGAIWSKGNDGKNIIEFYYSHEGYQRPPGAMSSAALDCFWSSSPSTAANYGYLFKGYMGVITSIKSSALCAIRCARPGFSLDSRKN